MTDSHSGPTGANGQAPGTAEHAVVAQDLRKSYGRGESAVAALDGVSVVFPRGQFAAVMGPSGSGKSTLMQCLAGLDTVTGGTVWIDGTPITGLRDRGLTRLRRDKIGFVFQAYNLVPTLTARQNIVLPLALARRRVDRAWFDEVVQTLGLTGRLKHRPHELSGGQQQRVAVARALLGRPAVIFADEPTGNLDSVAGAEVLALLRTSVQQWGQTVIMVTHDAVAASWSDRVVLLADGHISGELQDPTVDSVLAALHGARPAHDRSMA
ncbi:ABC transporter ATP-binding protein [Cryobacterium arcticum]|uniref:ABC transporter n=1 Tax=Cryobacterium arcticum TaxID=670052 RepID=A0A1B1BH58_9MICO|nr:ABC transporter ATP-binding protein [Cryobacterium arcticum]ANP71955.1 ABC transporter [Cryobacterium arcticum]